jgi:hypothetical protein
MKLLLTCEGEPSYKEAVQIVAKRKKTTMMKLVRQALDATYGPEIAREMSFFASDDASSHHKVTKGNKKAGAR